MISIFAVLIRLKFHDSIRIKHLGRFCRKTRINARESGRLRFLSFFDRIVAVAGRGENEIDRSDDGESFAAMRHLNWLNADKLQRCTHPVAPIASPRARAFSALFPRFFPANPPPPRRCVEDSPSGSLTGRMCRILFLC